MPGKKWTEHQLQLLRDMYPAQSTEAVAAAVGRPVNCVRKMAQLKGVHKSAEFISEQKKAQALHASGVFVACRFKPLHGMSDDKKAGSTYNAWSSMIARCCRASHKSYPNYGGAGVSICHEWRHSFLAFLRDMGPRPAGTTIDRWPNGSGNYEPGNCRWATPRQQARNRRSSVKMTAFGREGLMVEFAEQHGIRTDTLAWRINRLGMTPEAALLAPVQPRGVNRRPA